MFRITFFFKRKVGHLRDSRTLLYRSAIITEKAVTEQQVGFWQILSHATDILKDKKRGIV